MMSILHKLFSFFLILIFSTGFSQLKNNNDRPKLVVGIVVDQMRWDYLYKYYDRYGDDGFKRLLNQGFTAENTLIPYVPTYTAIGHSSIYTGSVPAIHGIAGNDFYIRETQKRMYCTQDDDVTGVGLDAEKKAGKMSPKNLLTTTITDELKLATDFKSKVIGVSLKDRGAILPAGHFADAAYWNVDGNWVSSSFYMKVLPKFVQDFNKADYTGKYLNGKWETLYPIDTYMNHVGDDNPYEEKFKNQKTVTFPIDLKKALKEEGRELIKSTPFGNSVTLQFAKEIINREKMGANPAGVPDFLAVSLSSTDYIGHQFAINSLKIEDTYLRLDKDLGEFFDFLDQNIGQGNYLIFLTADHGAAHNPQFIEDNKGNSGFWQRKEVLKNLNSVLETEFGHQKLVYTISNNQAFLDYQQIESLKLDDEAIKKSAIQFLKKQEGVLFAADMEKLSTSSMPARVKEMAINGYNYKRSGDIQLILDPQWYGYWGSKEGTTHGAWNPYDSHIPLVFMGWGIKKGSTHRTTYMTDIAPTLSALLHIQQPNGSIGEAVYEITDDN